MLEFRLLGPLEVAGDRGLISLGGPRQRATLAILLLSANRVVSIDRLADDLYSGAPPVTAVTQVQRQVSDLRKALGSASVIETRSPGYVIRLTPEQLDLGRFERLTEEARRAFVGGDARLAAELLREALAVWRGAPLADLAFEPFAQSAIGRLEEIRLLALEQRIDAELAIGRHAELIGELEQLVFDEPLREHLRGQLMLALYRSGRQAEALDVCAKARATLVDEFGIELSPALRDLERAILNQDPSLELRPDRSPSVHGTGALLVLPRTEEGLDRLLAIAEPLASVSGRELLLIRLLSKQEDVGQAASTLKARRASVGVPSRSAAFTALEPTREVLRLAATYDVELVVLDAPPSSRGSSSRPILQPSWSVRLPTSACSPGRQPVGKMGRCSSRSPAANTIGRRSNWPPGCAPRRLLRFGSWARRRTREVAVATLVACWPMRPWPYSGLCASTPNRCSWSRPVRRWRTQASEHSSL